MSPMSDLHYGVVGDSHWVMLVWEASVFASLAGPSLRPTSVASKWCACIHSACTHGAEHQWYCCWPANNSVFAAYMLHTTACAPLLTSFPLRSCECWSKQTRSCPTCPLWLARLVELRISSTRAMAASTSLMQGAASGDSCSPEGLGELGLAHMSCWCICWCASARVTWRSQPGHVASSAVVSRR